MAVVAVAAFALMLAVSVAPVTAASSVDQPAMSRPTQGSTGEMKAGETAPDKKGGEAVVSGVDRPENCLRVRSEASTSGEIIACAKEGDKLHLTGVFSDDGRWAQLDKGGWVFVRQIKSDLKAPRTAAGDWERPAGAAGSQPSEAPAAVEVPTEAFEASQSAALTDDTFYYQDTPGYYDGRMYLSGPSYVRGRGYFPGPAIEYGVGSTMGPFSP